MTSRFAPWAVLLLALLSFGIGLAELPVQDRDEARFAQAARQMAETGDLIDIRLLDQPRHNKPALIYWAQSAAIWLTGAEGTTPIWVHRLPSYLAGVFSAFALIWAGTPLVGRRAAILAGIMCATVYMLHAEARTAKTDAALLLSVILAMGALGHIWMGKARSVLTPAIFWTAMAAGFLLKGPMVALPVLGAILWCSAFARDLRWLAALRPLPGMVWMLALTTPWFIAITIVTDGAFWSASLGTDLTDKITTEGEHSGSPPGLYLLTIWLTFWPWSVILPMAAIVGWRGRKRPDIAFLLGWLVPAWLVFEAVPVKLLHYTLPLYPPLMLLGAVALWQLAEGEMRFRRWIAALGGFGFLLGLGAFTAALIAAPWIYGDAVPWLAWFGAAITLLAGFGALISLWRAELTQSVTCLALAGIIVGWTLSAVSLPASTDLRLAKRIATAMAQHTCFAPPVALAGFSEPSAAFYMGGEVVFLDTETAFDYLAAETGRSVWIDARRLDDAPPPGVPEITEIDGLNFANFREVTMRLFVSPGVPAPAEPCSS
ncbi:glycosyltransferase family 39 protein [Gymnodinialimonas sp. 2305UL16-5]|uniref:ArnT family glycosyltransferase n=1 Tax=Gymnodinialimonas mytili TaxID=3126503 RepID=UPI0030A39C5B